MELEWSVSYATFQRTRTDVKQNIIIIYYVSELMFTISADHLLLDRRGVRKVMKFVITLVYS